MSIYITGDTHGEIARFTPANLPCSYWTMEDCLIIAGDFGMIFFQDESDEKKLDYLERLGFEILFIDGNHEAFPRLNAYPVEEYCGGKVHRIRRNVRHLMRGQVFTIQDVTVFTLGGGYSMDRPLRTPHVNWWKEELPNEDEYYEATLNLKKHNFRVDYIVTHVPPADTLELFRQMNLVSHISHKQARLDNYLESVRENVRFQHWYFGHMHMDRALWRKQTAVYFDVYDMKTGEKVE